jgi:hypothetical protein
MRFALILAACLALLVSSAASAGPRSRNSKCDWIARQLVHADEMKVRAAEIDDELGLDKFENRIVYLEGHFKEHCPQQYAAAKADQTFAALMKAAMRAALTYLTMGAY